MIANAFIIFAIAYSVSSLDGFLGIFASLRKTLLQAKIPNHPSWENLFNHLGKGASCPYCVAVWAAIALTPIQGNVILQLSSLGLAYLIISLNNALSNWQRYVKFFING